MSIFDNFFEPASNTSTTTKNSKYNSKQDALLNALLNETSAGLATGAQTYNGDMYTGTNPYEAEFFKSAGAGTDNQAVREAALRESISGNPAYEINPEATQGYWDNYIQPQVNKQQRALNEQYAPGIFSGGRDIAQGEFNTGVLGQYANLQYQDEQARRAAATEAANRRANIINTAWSNNATLQQNAGALERSNEEKALTTDYQRWMSGEADPVTGEVNQAANPYRALAMNLLGISPYVYGNNITSSGAGLGYSAASGAAGSIGQMAASALPGIASSAWGAIKDSDWWQRLTSSGEMTDYDVLQALNDSGVDFDPFENEVVGDWTGDSSIEG